MSHIPLELTDHPLDARKGLDWDAVNRVSARRNEVDVRDAKRLDGRSVFVAHLMEKRTRKEAKSGAERRPSTQLQRNSVVTMDGGGRCTTRRCDELCDLLTGSI